MRRLTVVCLVVGLAACSDDPTGSGDATGGDATEATTTTVAPDVTSSDDDAVTTTDDSTIVPDSTVAPSDTVEDTTPDVDVIPDPGIVADDSLCSPLDGKVTNIYDIQNPNCPDHPANEPTSNPGQYVELTGVIVTGTFGDTWFVQDDRSGPYSGVQIFNHGLMSGTVKVGDVLSITGSYYEFYESSQVYLTTVDVTGTHAVPPPFVAEYPEYLATNGALAEMFEGVLVRVNNVGTTNTRPDCPLEYGEFEVNGRLRIDDLSCRSGDPAGPCSNGFRWKAHLGDRFASVTGPLHYTFGNHKIEPRDATDLVVTTTGDASGISKCIASECQAPASDPGTKQIVINEILADPWQQDTNQEWIELYNPGSSAVDVNGWQLRDCGDQAYTMSGPDLTIPSHGYLVVGMNTNENLNGGASVDLAYGNAFYLPNTVGSVLLYTGPGTTGALVDQTRYEAFSPWDWASGKSLERKSATSDGTIPESWKKASTEYGENGNYGTPGKRND